MLTAIGRMIVCAICLCLTSGGVADSKPPVRAKHSIIGYKRDVMLQLVDRYVETEFDTSAWKQSPLYQITISKSGKVLSVKLLKGTGKANCDKLLICMLSNTKFSPIPSWYGKNSVSFILGYSCDKEIGQESLRR